MLPFSFPKCSQITCTMNKTDNIFTFRAVCSFFAQSLLGRVCALPLYLSAHARSSHTRRYDTGYPRTTSHQESAQASFVLLLLLCSFFFMSLLPHNSISKQQVPQLKVSVFFFSAKLVYRKHHPAVQVAILATQRFKLSPI